MSCFLIKIWRIYKIDVAKLWPNVVAEKGYPPEALPEKVEEIIDYALKNCAKPLYNELINQIRGEYGDSFLDELVRVEELLMDYGNYSNDLVPSVGFVFYITEVLSGVFSYVPETFLKVLEKTKERGQDKESTFGKPLKHIMNDDGSIEIMMGVIVKEVPELCYMIIE